MERPRVDPTKLPPVSKDFAPIVAITISPTLENRRFPGSQYSNATRIHAVAAYAVHGSVSKAAQDTGIPRATVAQWSQQDWWHSVYTEIQQQHEARFRAGFDQITARAQGAVLDRLENGDTKLVQIRDADGSTDYVEKRVPVTGKDASVMMAIAYDKGRISRNLPTSISSSQSDGNALAELAKQFAQISGRTLDGEARDVTPPKIAPATPDVPPDSGD